MLFINLLTHASMPPGSRALMSVVYFETDNATWTKFMDYTHAWYAALTDNTKFENVQAFGRRLREAIVIR